MDKIKILLVEDEAVLAMLIRETLETQGFEIRVAANGVEGWSQFNNYQPDLCIVDVFMPRKDGFSLVSDIRKVNEQIPIIFLTARTQTADVIKGLETGADDYMKKPFSMAELILRIKSLIKRSLPLPAGTDEPAGDLDVGGFTFSLRKLELSIGEKKHHLSQREAELLNLLARHQNKLLDRKTALLKLWGNDDAFNARSMDVYITRLRKLLKADPSLEIQNIRGYGYKLIVR